MVCFFDPTAWPTKVDGKLHTTLGFFEELSKNGKVWFSNTGADGAYLFHFYVDEEIPERIKEYIQDPKETNLFHVPSGSLTACGAEFAASDPQKAGLDKFPHMGGNFKLLAGDYTVKAWRVEWPEETIEEELEKCLGKKHLDATNRIGIATGVLFVGTLVASIVAFFKTLASLGSIGLNLKLLWIALIICWSIVILLMRMLSKAEKNPQRIEVERQFPSIVVQMKKI
jgi:hypothetical protein